MNKKKILSKLAFVGLLLSVAACAQEKSSCPVGGNLVSAPITGNNGTIDQGVAALFKNVINASDADSFKVKEFRFNQNKNTLRIHTDTSTATNFWQIDNGKPFVPSENGYYIHTNIYAFIDLNFDGTLDFIFGIDPRTNGRPIDNYGFALVNKNGDITVAKQNGRPYYSKSAFEIISLCAQKDKTFMMDIIEHSDPTAEPEGTKARWNVDFVGEQFNVIAYDE